MRVLLILLFLSQFPLSLMPVVGGADANSDTIDNIVNSDPDDKTIVPGLTIEPTPYAAVHARKVRGPTLRDRCYNYFPSTDSLNFPALLIHFLFIVPPPLPAFILFYFHNDRPPRGFAKTLMPPPRRADISPEKIIRVVRARRKLARVRLHRPHR